MKNDFIRSIKFLRTALNQKQKRNFILTNILSFVHSLLDLLALILLFAVLGSVFNQDGQIFQVFERIHETLGFEETNRQRMYINVLAVLVLIFVLKNTSSYFSKRFQVRLSFDVARTLSDKLYGTKLRSKLVDHKNQQTSELNHTINSISIYLSDYVLLPTQTILSESFLGILILLSVLLYSGSLFVFLILFLIPAALFIAAFSRKKLKRLGHRLNELTPELLTNTQKLVHGFVELKLAGREENLLKEFQKLRENVHKTRENIFLQHSVVHTHFMETMVVVGVLALAIITYSMPEFGAFETSLVLFGTMAFRLIPSVNRVISGNNTLRTFSYVLDMIEDAQVQEEIDEGSEQVNFNSALELDGIRFTYPNGHQVLRDLSLKIEKHKKIGIYGQSGSGKTTLINLIMGFYSPESGDIKVDGAPLNRENIKSWRTKLGYVKQDSFLSSGSILENIAFGFPKDEIDHGKVEQCLSKAKLSSWVHSLPNGLDTEIGELGAKISGGQKQRIAIARMLYKEAELLILDEITNSLDTTTAAEVLNTVYHLNNSKSTIVMISHKPEEFHSCDHVYKLQAGQLIEIND